MEGGGGEGGSEVVDREFGEGRWEVKKSEIKEEG